MLKFGSTLTGIYWVILKSYATTQWKRPQNKPLYTMAQLSDNSLPCDGSGPSQGGLRKMRAQEPAFVSVA